MKAIMASSREARSFSLHNLCGAASLNGPSSFDSAASPGSLLGQDAGHGSAA